METEKILRYYFNDAANIILEFLCPPNPDFYEACEFGYYEKVIKNIELERFLARCNLDPCRSRPSLDFGRGFYLASQNNYTNIINLIKQNYGASNQAFPLLALQF